MTVIIWKDMTNKRSQKLAESVATGLHTLGVRYETRIAQSHFHGEAFGDIAVLYGKRQPLWDIFHCYKEVSKTIVYMDLGYWKRMIGARYEGYHKIAVNDFQPTNYCFRKNHSIDRLKELGITLKIKSNIPSKDNYILLVGMSQKQATVGPYDFEQWEKMMVTKLRTLTNRPIAYKPKNTCDAVASRTLADIYIAGDTPIEHALAHTHMVVTRHSNVGVDAIVNNVPVYAEEGVASVMSQRLEDIENPEPMDMVQRQKFIQDIAYAQWNVPEMRTGKMWKHLQEEGLVP